MKTKIKNRGAGEGADGRRGRASRRCARRVTVLSFVMVLWAAMSGAAWAAPGGIAEVQQFASRLTNYVTAVAASVAVLFIAVNGVRWTMSSGNPAKQAEAKNGLAAAGVGLAIALSANLVVNLVVAALR